MGGMIVVVILGLWILSSMIKIVPEYERMVVFRLGRYIGVSGPGLVFLLPFIDEGRRIDMRVLAMDVPQQDIITKDNVSVRVDAVVYMKVVDPAKAILQVEDYDYATSQLAQTTLRSVIGEMELDEVLANRERINSRLQEILDRETDPWGIKVISVEVKKVDLPESMQRVMARQAEAERERRAKILAAEGELQAADKLKKAAEMLKDPVAMQIRYLQTLTAIANEVKSQLIVFPIPIELLTMFKKNAGEIKSGKVVKVVHKNNNTTQSHQDHSES